jgi:hypothetical protein
LPLPGSAGAAANMSNQDRGNLPPSWPSPSTPSSSSSSSISRLLRDSIGMQLIYLFRCCMQ